MQFLSPNIAKDAQHLTAVVLARMPQKTDGKRVYVLGRSLGSTMAPRIAQGDPVIAGIIILTGAACSQEQSMIDPMRYLAQFNGQFDADERRILEDLELFEQRVKAIKAGAIRVSTRIMGR